MLRGVASERHYNGKNPSTGHNGFFLQKLESSHYNIIGTMAMAASDNPAGRILGVIGMGQVGLAAGKRAVALGMRIHYHGRSRKAAAIEDLLGGATFHTELKTMLEIADCVLLACPYNTTTHHILDKDAFAVMKRGVRIVNVGRGKCMDEGALAEAIELGIVAGAGLDVFYDE
jgi:lactate dehydrogenase-like 2-hydroxyacid dehydrogenase